MNKKTLSITILILAGITGGYFAFIKYNNNNVASARRESLKKMSKFNFVETKWEIAGSIRSELFNIINNDYDGVSTIEFPNETFFKLYDNSHMLIVDGDYWVKGDSIFFQRIVVSKDTLSNEIPRSKCIDSFELLRFEDKLKMYGKNSCTETDGIVTLKQILN